MLKTVFTLLLTLQMLEISAQQFSAVKGKVQESQKPLQNAIVSILNTSITQLTDSKGEFYLEKIPSGSQLILFKSVSYKDQLLTIKLNPGVTLDLGLIIMEQDQSIEKQQSIVALTDDDLEDDNSGSDNTAILLQSSRDAFQQVSAFNWGQARFRMRGLSSEYSNIMANGIILNKIYDGRPQWNNWGGLNDVTRNQEFTTGTAPSDYTFGNIFGTQYINTRASNYRPGSRVSFSGANTNYDWRVMGTYVSGMNKNGWAFVVSAGKRWADEGYFEGTNYNANSLFTSIEKKLNNSHSLNLTGIYAKNSRGITAPETAEVTNLVGEKFNSYWGWQDNQKRNSRIKEIEEPILILNHYWKINDKNRLNSAIAYQFGKIGNSRIDYQNANSPDPVYYKNLPSYWTSLYAPDQGEYPGSPAPNYAEASATQSAFLNNHQLDWNSMYKANSVPITNGNNEIIGYQPSQSKYVLYEDRTDDKTFTFNSNLNSQLSDNISLNSGITYRKLKSENFQNLLDLLGGTSFADIDPFFSGNQSQSDLNHPNRMVGVGDKYGYHYNLFANVIEAFTQFRFSYQKVNFYLAQSFSNTTYQREGLYKNGLYPMNSFGKSAVTNFENFGFKGGLTYKISGKQFLNLNLAHSTKAPSLRNTYPNARLNNNTVDNPEREIISAGDLSYIIRSPKFNARITMYFSQIENAVETHFFYAEGIFMDDHSTSINESNAFVAETTTNLSKRNIGTEIGLDYSFSPNLKLISALALGQFTYSNNPTVWITNDALASINNSNPTVNFGQASLKNYKQSGTPQQAVSLGLDYRNDKHWSLGLNMNCLVNNYVDISHIRRTSQFYINPDTGFPFPEATEERGRELLKQEKFNPAWLLNMTGGKFWKIKNNTLGIFASLNNLLNYSYKISGYEQPRDANFRSLNQDVSSGTPAFAPKYYYGFGRTFFANLYFNF